MRDAVIVDAVRTPLAKGKPSGAYAGVHPVELHAHVLRALAERVPDFDPAELDDVIGGAVGQAGEQSGNTTRLAALAAGFPESVPGVTVDRQCGSSQQALSFAAQGVISGAYDLVIASGVESMSRIPIGSQTLGRDVGGPLISARYPGGLIPQGVAAELIARKWGLSRTQLDEFALLSHQNAAQAWRELRFAHQVVPLFKTFPAYEESPVPPVPGVPARGAGSGGAPFDGTSSTPRVSGSSGAPSALGGSPALGASAALGGSSASGARSGLVARAILETDETVRADTSLDAMSGLRPAFADPHWEQRFGVIDWKVTAGNSSPVNDGAAALLVTTSENAARHGWRPRARIHTAVAVGDDPIHMLTGIIPATARVLRRSGLSLSDIDAFEVNEAFSSVVLAWQAETGADPSKVNIDGGAIAIGHPLGASGARLATTLLGVLERTGGRYGLQTMCEAGGTANATIIERL